MVGTCPGHLHFPDLARTVGFWSQFKLAPCLPPPLLQWNCGELAALIPRQMNGGRNAVAVLSADDHCQQLFHSADASRHRQERGLTMTRISKSLRYRRLACRETNREIISLLTRLADEAESREKQQADAPRGPAYVVSISGRLAAKAAA